MRMLITQVVAAIVITVGVGVAKQFGFCSGDEVTIGILLVLLSVQIDLACQIVSLRLGVTAYGSISRILEDQRTHCSTIAQIDGRPDPVLRERAKSLRDELDRIAKDGMMRVRSRWDVYRIDKQYLDNMVSGEVFRATVPVFEHHLQEQLQDADFQKYIEAQVRAVARGVVVQRLYLIDTAELYSRTEMRAHMDRLLAAGIRLKYMIGTESGPEKMDVDLVFFGNRVVSWGTPREERLDDMETAFCTDATLLATKLKGWGALWDSPNAHEYVLSGGVCQTGAPLPTMEGRRRGGKARRSSTPLGGSGETSSHLGK
jgi:hypothetical protein